MGLGKALAMHAMAVARVMGYRFMRLDTLRAMISAKAMYEELGLIDVKPYYANPLEGTRFMEVDLRQD